LGVKFTSLHVGAVGFADSGFGALVTVVRDAPHAITRIDKEEKDKDEGNLESILDFRDLLLG
jgi:hypothetical protein